MAHNLEAPCAPGSRDWSRLYRARGSEVVAHRPYFTGDVFDQVVIEGNNKAKRKRVMITQHPCSMRANGIDLAPKLLVAEVRNHRVLQPDEWTGFIKNMPLPELIPMSTSRQRDQAAFFDQLHLVRPDRLESRVACLSQLGVNLLLQRWVMHNSRVVVPTVTLHEATSGVYEEADFIEEWSEERVAAGIPAREAASECMAWLREEVDGVRRQRMLEDGQLRSEVRRQMRRVLRSIDDAVSGARSA